MKALDIKEKITQLEVETIALPQVDCPVIHRFGPGIYIREVTLPAGALVIGHKHRFEHTNIMLKGKMTLLDEDGTTRRLEAPFIYVGNPGRKIAYIFEEVVWQNIYATDETDVEKLEEMFLDKNELWIAHKGKSDSIARLLHEGDREDYLEAIKDYGFTPEEVRKISENESDLLRIPFGGYKVKVGDSPIEGKGLFATADIQEGEVIMPARVGNSRTIAGRYTNHAQEPNARMILLKNNDIDLVATRNISGCKGGMDGEEITIDYRQALSLSHRKMEA